MGPDAKQTIQMAALGRPFSLGTLYDCRKDSLIPSMTLWDHDELLNHIGERPQCYNDFEIVTSESIDDKCSSLKADASLKLSFLFGMFELNGSARYLNDYKKSKHQARVTLKYEATTKFRELSMDHLGRANVKHPDVFEKGVATHVVTAVLYGAQAFFVFDREVSKEEDHQVVEGNLKAMVQWIPLIKAGASVSMKLNDESTANVEKFSCTFHGDFFLEKNPVTYQDAVQVYQDLPKLLGANRENVVPLKVWLLPLTCLDSGATQLVCQISTHFVRTVQTVIENLSELEMRCNDALKTTIVEQFPEIRKKLEKFKKLCSDFKDKFQQDLTEKLPLIRGGEEEEDLGDTSNMDNLMNSTNLNKWMDCKEKEICILKSITKMMNNTKIVPSQNDLHEEILSSEHAVCFVFTSLGSDEPYLSALSNYLNQTLKPDDCQDPYSHDIEREQWYTSPEVSEAVMNEAKLFSDFAEANKENKNIKFLTVGLTNERQQGSSIYVYKDVLSINENFEPPSKLETVTAGDVTHNSVTLKISPPRFGAENIICYSLEYCVSGEDEWQKTTAPKAEEVTVSGLTPNTEYMFRCRAVTSIGVGPAGEVSGPNKALSGSSPGKPQVETNTLKDKYKKDTNEKSSIQHLIKREEEEIVRLQDWIVSLMDQSAQCVTRLQEIALRPNSLTTPEYIDMLIEGEKSEAKEGYQARIQSLEAMKNRAKTISKEAK
ncbi:verrucotoxin subunit beta-like [Scomber japonicus]|uniref:verrucotoxin subunit beta-like n=1 Tax=Scomber japonicus TaxID=13676 RepID=UPI002306B522|nr:verrucotoxin subunit beta-like [Scomber japonicus]